MSKRTEPGPGQESVWDYPRYPLSISISDRLADLLRSLTSSVSSLVSWAYPLKRYLNHSMFTLKLLTAFKKCIRESNSLNILCRPPSCESTSDHVQVYLDDEVCSYLRLSRRSLRVCLLFGVPQSLEFEIKALGICTPNDAVFWIRSLPTPSSHTGSWRPLTLL